MKIYLIYSVNQHGGGSFSDHQALSATVADRSRSSFSLTERAERLHRRVAESLICFHLKFGSIPNSSLCFGIYPKIYGVRPKLIPKEVWHNFSHQESWETSLESCGELDLFCICCRERLSFLLVCGNIKNTKVVDKQLRICFPHSERESWIWATKGSVVSNLKTNIIQSINCCYS